MGKAHAQHTPKLPELLARIPGASRPSQAGLLHLCRLQLPHVVVGVQPGGLASVVATAAACLADAHATAAVGVHSCSAACGMWCVLLATAWCEASASQPQMPRLRETAATGAAGRTGAAWRAAEHALGGPGKPTAAAGGQAGAGNSAAREAR